MEHFCDGEKIIKVCDQKSQRLLVEILWHIANVVSSDREKYMIYFTDEGVHQTLCDILLANLHYNTAEIWLLAIWVMSVFVRVLNLEEPKIAKPLWHFTYSVYPYISQILSQETLPQNLVNELRQDWLFLLAQQAPHADLTQLENLP